MSGPASVPAPAAAQAARTTARAEGGRRERLANRYSSKWLVSGVTAGGVKG